MFSIKDTYAYDKSTYASRKLCGTYELALFKSDGSIEKVSCHDTYDKANAAMKADGRKDLAVLGTQSGKVKIFNAMSALVDLTHPSGTFDIYEDTGLKNAHTYMVGESGYGGVDAALLSNKTETKSGLYLSLTMVGLEILLYIIFLIGFPAVRTRLLYMIVPLVGILMAGSMCIFITGKLEQKNFLKEK